MAANFDRDGPTRYSHTPRKVFDRAIDRLHLKRQRDREDHRNDMETIVRQIRKLENQLTQILEERHANDSCSPNCKYCTEGLE